jgi:hypothetical protein
MVGMPTQLKEDEEHAYRAPFPNAGFRAAEQAFPKFGVPTVNNTPKGWGGKAVFAQAHQPPDAELALRLLQEFTR